MEVIEVVRRWQAGESQRRIAQATGLSRNTVEKYLRVAREAGSAFESARLKKAVRLPAQLVLLSSRDAVRGAPAPRRECRPQGLRVGVRVP